MRNRLLSPVVALFAVAVSPLVATIDSVSGRQIERPQPVRPAAPRDVAPGPAAQAVGTGQIAGVVTLGGGGQPARKVRVSISGTVSGAVETPGFSRSVMTDDSGRFSFTALPAGRFTLSASKSGYLSASFGQRRPGLSGTPIQLADGQRFSAQLTLPRAGVITGTVLDEHGDAVPGTGVRAHRVVNQGGRRVLQQAGSGSTDDRGVYRMYGLQPGEYLVSANPRGSSAGTDAERMRQEVLSIGQRLQQVGAADQVQAASLMQRAATLQASLGATEVPTSGYAPVFYPGTTSAGGAGAVTLGPGDEKASIDFSLQLVPISQVTGVVIGPTAGAPPPNVQISLVSRPYGATGLSPSSARADAQGNFRLANVAPGQYTLLVRATVGDAARGRGQAPTPVSGRGDGRGRGAVIAQPTRYWASAEVNVDGREVPNIVLTLQPGVTASGRIVFDGAAPPPADMTRTRVTLLPLPDGDAPSEALSSAAGRVEADGRFSIASVVPGRYRLSASSAGDGWFLGSATVDGQDALDGAIEIKPTGGFSSGVVTFIDRQSAISGAVVNEQGQPVTDYTLVLYPADQRLWVPQSRRIRNTRPSTDGRYQFGNVPPGDYRIAPVLDPEPGAWTDPAFLQQIDGNALRVTLNEGEKKELPIRLATRP